MRYLYQILLVGLVSSVGLNCTQTKSPSETTQSKDVPSGSMNSTNPSVAVVMKSTPQENASRIDAKFEGFSQCIQRSVADDKVQLQEKRSAIVKPPDECARVRCHNI